MNAIGWQIDSKLQCIIQRLWLNDITDLLARSFLDVLIDRVILNSPPGFILHHYLYVTSV